ncbi:hypothetical protein EI94DRAFT_1717113 [Lactarius quietus]|nr:hypothetical protein EI94DRAFT_1717113 [Lactarius quietus]
MAVNPQTWYSAYMSGYRHTSASSPARPTTSQAEMKDRILEEFKCATFSVDLTAERAPLQADPNDVQRVIDYLRDNCNVTHVTLFNGGNSTEDAPRFPSDGFGAERWSYEPLTHLLNSIIAAANWILTGPCYLKALRFHPYGVDMRDTLNLHKPLKPDILGLLDPLTPHTQTLKERKIYWNEVAVYIEVKNDLTEMIKQLAMYARNHLALNRRRSFSIAMSFNHKTMKLGFLCFHRSGISASPQLKLNGENGFRSFVEHLVGLLSIKDEEAFGLDMTRVDNVYCLNCSDYKIERTIQMHKRIRGHSTVVYSLKRAELVFWLVHPRLTFCAPRTNWTCPRYSSWTVISGANKCCG